MLTFQSHCFIFLSNTERSLALRVHIVGAEKVNFLDAFKEVAYLLEDFATELVLLFVRTCFLLLRSDERQGEFAFKLTNSLRIVLVVEWNMGFFRSKL
jgi:hypothetical protein